MCKATVSTRQATEWIFDNCSEPCLTCGANIPNILSTTMLNAQLKALEAPIIHGTLHAF